MNDAERKAGMIERHARRLLRDGDSVAGILKFLKKPEVHYGDQAAHWAAVSDLVLKCAKRGRTAHPLIDYLKAGGVMTPEISAYLVAILEGRVKVGRKPVKASQLVTRQEAENTVKMLTRDLVACAKGDDALWQLMLAEHARFGFSNVPPSGVREAKSMARDLAVHWLRLNSRDELDRLLHRSPPKKSAA